MRFFSYKTKRKGGALRPSFAFHTMR